MRASQETAEKKLDAPGAERSCELLPAGWHYFRAMRPRFAVRGQDEPSGDDYHRFGARFSETGAAVSPHYVVEGNHTQQPLHVGAMLYRQQRPFANQIAKAPSK